MQDDTYKDPAEAANFDAAFRTRCLQFLNPTLPETRHLRGAERRAFHRELPGGHTGTTTRLSGAFTEEADSSTVRFVSQRGREAEANAGHDTNRGEGGANDPNPNEAADSGNTGEDARPANGNAGGNTGEDARPAGGTAGANRGEDDEEEAAPARNNMGEGNMGAGYDTGYNANQDHPPPFGRYDYL